MRRDKRNVVCKGTHGEVHRVNGTRKVKRREKDALLLQPDAHLPTGTQFTEQRVFAAVMITQLAAGQAAKTPSNENIC